MGRDEAAPFARGETIYNGGVIDSTDNTTLAGVNYEGKEFYFEPGSPNATVTGAVVQEETGRGVWCRVVRNLSGVNLKPSRIVHYKPTDPYQTRIDGYCFAVGDLPAGVVDEFLPAAGVVPYDLFYIVVAGPTKVKQTHTSNSSLAIGDRLVPTAGGGASLTDDLSGRVLKQAQVTIADGPTTVAAFANIQNVIGFAGEANNTVDALVKAVVALPSRSR